MHLDDYKKHAELITKQPDKNRQRELFYNLMVVFVQDCWLTGVEPYYGNLTKAKADILFDLHECVSP